MREATRINQTQRVLAWMRYGAWWSGIQFVKNLRILCYTKRISELRQQGHKIEKRWNHKGFYEYRLERP
jgi:hypothetical protein